MTQPAFCRLELCIGRVVMSLTTFSVVFSANGLDLPDTSVLLGQPMCMWQICWQLIATMI